MKKIIFSFVSLGIISLISASCFLQRPRTPASDTDRLSLSEMQLLSKDATFRFFKSDTAKPEALTYQLTEAEKTDLPNAVAKLRALLNQPTLVNQTWQESFSNTGIDRTPGRNEVRVTSWNIERGQEFETIKTLFSASENGKCNPQKAEQALNWQRNKKGNTILDPDKKQRILDEVCALNETDILLLNEVDNGVCRSAYKDVAAELATHLKMNYVFAPSFFEAEPAKSGLAPALNVYCKEENLEATRNLTGNAILSRYPLQNVKVLALPVGYLTKEGQAATKKDHDAYCYDWFTDEIKGPTLIDKGIRVGIKVAFNEDVGRELRYGGRNAIVADVQLPMGVVTVVTTHLENKAKPSCRQAQMRYLLNQVKTTHPLVIGGDMNTTGVDGGRYGVTTTAWDLVIGQTVKSQGFWLRIFDVGIPSLSLSISGAKTAVSKLTLTQNPTRRDLFWLRPNPEGHLFSFMKDQGFVFKGNELSSVAGKNEGPWSTTNSRDKIGFEGTHYLNKTYLTIGASKLDWFFVKNNHDKCAQPKFPRTLGGLREGLGAENFPSDHVPITLIFEAPCN